MTKNELISLYFEWMCQLVCEKRHSKKPPYLRLLRYLFETEFRYLVPLDGNRAEDGVDLRYRFADIYSYDYGLVAHVLDTRPCSVLEMLVALAIRCEEHIMGDPDIGDRTGQWFWNMIESLNLSAMNDMAFDRAFVSHAVSTFLNRNYKRNGAGGLFTVENSKYDFRSAEIWYQMCWYLDSLL